MQSLPVLGGRYRLGPVIGRGGMGTVHRAWDEALGRELAVKVLRAGADHTAQERLRREAQYLAGLMHPHLVGVLDVGADGPQDAETVWFAMELVGGPDLSALLNRSGPLDGAATARVLAGVLSALDALHAAGVVHRDLKPANVLLTADPADGDWDVKLTDLGIAHRLSTEHLTSTGQIIGTVAYLSPEQIAGAEVGPAADVYAAGLMAIEALTGRPAFAGGAAEAAGARLVRGPVLPSALEPRWSALLAAMTAVDPDDRPSAARLRAAVAGLPATAFEPETATEPFDADATRVLPVAAPPGTDVVPRRPRPARRRRRALVGVGALLIVGGTCGGGALLTRVVPPAAEAATTTTTQASVAAVAPVARRTTPAPTSSSAPTATSTPTSTPSPTTTPSRTTGPAATAARSSRTDRTLHLWRRWADRLHRLRHHPGHPHR